MSDPDTRQWTHRATWPDEPKKHESDKVVLCDGERVGRAYYVVGGPQGGKWQWTGLWAGWGNAGVADTRDEALEALRRAYAKALEEQPDRITDMIERSRAAERSKHGHE